MDEGPTYDEEDNWQGPEGCIPIGGMHHHWRRLEQDQDHNSQMNPRSQKFDPDLPNNNKQAITK